MADISSITLPGGGTYDLKDKNAVPKYGKGKNLLDNAYFVGGGTGRGVFPVNQRGQSSYTGLVYGIDRWYSLTTGGTLTIGADYITLQAATYNFNWRQTLSRKIPIGSAVTITVLKGDGSLVSGSGILSSSTSFVQVALTSGYIRAYYDYVQITTGANNSNTIKAIWMELGTEQTLCHNEGTAEAPVWVLNDVPDYEYELYRCITSTADSSDTYANKSLATEQQLAYVEMGTTASRNYIAGQYICWNGLLYTADTNIVSGATLSDSGGNKNLTETTIGNSLYTSIGYASSSASISSVTGTIVRVGVNYIFNLQIVVGTAIARFIPLVEFSAPTSVRTTVTNPAVWIVNHQAAGTQYTGYVGYANSKHVISSSTQLPVGTYSVYAVVTMM